VLESLYWDRDTWVHRLSAGLKLACVVVLGSVVFMIDDFALVGIALALVVLLFIAAQVPADVAWRQFRVAVPVLVIIFAAQLWLADWQFAVMVVVRFALLISAASLVSLTTRTSAMIGALEMFLSPLGKFGVDVGKISLTLAMAIRFIPEVIRITRDVREAQRVRGLETSLFAVAMPVIIRLLRTADDVADAIEARSP
tara:strand:+ start:158949 stop:159542 length:594 start_codon:yes stop_codon:yes gene_type:complete